MKNKLFFIIGALTIITLIAAFLLLINNANKDNLTKTLQQENKKPSEEIVNVLNNTQKVSLSSNGFSPKIITIAKGTRVLWVNESSESASINSDPFPVNTYWKFLNLGNFENGDSMSLIFESKGKYTYHNQFKPEQTGTIIVN